MYTITAYHSGTVAHAVTVTSAKNALNARIEALLFGGRDSTRLVTIQGPDGVLVAYAEKGEPIVYVEGSFRREADRRMAEIESRPSPNLLRVRMA